MIGRSPAPRFYPARRAASILVLLGIGTLAACDVPAPDRSRVALGPADGADLPATDTGRVAVGDTAPDFTLLDRQGRPVTLSELRGRRIILAFYRGHW